MVSRVVVTGMGIISAIGENLSENYDSLHKSKSGISSATHFKSVYTATLPFGEVKKSNDELKEYLHLQNEKGLTRTCLLAVKAFEEAIQNAGLSNENISSYDTALISASTVGGMCLTDQLYEDANNHSEGSEYLNAYGCAAHTLKLAELFGIRGFTDTINTACSSSANAIMLGARLIKSGRAKRVIVGGVDSLAKYTVNGFNALKILSDSPSKPFDQDRDGLNLGEAAAYLVLEAEEMTRGVKKNYAEITGYGNANDAHHPSAMSDDAVGAILSMGRAIESSGISSDQIDYVNAHGTGTPNNDQVELFGLEQIFKKMPHYNSTKSYTGHTLGAAGAVEAIFSILSIMHSEIFAGLNVQKPLCTEHPAVSQLKENIPVSHVLSNSFGFGGNCTSVVLSKYKP